MGYVKLIPCCVVADLIVWFSFFFKHTSACGNPQVPLDFYLGTQVRNNDMSSSPKQLARTSMITR